MYNIDVLNYPFFIRRILTKAWQPVMHHNVWTCNSEKPDETMNIPWWCIHGRWMFELCNECSKLDLRGSRERVWQHHG